MNTVLLDIEADGLEPEKLKDITCVVTKEVETNTALSWGGPMVLHSSGAIGLAYGGTLADMVVYLRGKRLVAHNGIGYDFPAIRTVTGMSLTTLGETEATIEDSMIWTQMIFPDLMQRDMGTTIPPELTGNYGLRAWGHRLKQPKGDFAGPWDVCTPTMLSYCLGDVLTLEKIWGIIAKRRDLPQFTRFSINEFQVAEILHEQERNGFELDIPACHALTAKLSSRRAELTGELQVLFPPREEEMKTPAYWEVLPELRDPPLFEGADLSEQYQFPTKIIAKRSGWKDKELRRGPNKIKYHPFNPNSRNQIAARLIKKYGWKPTKFTDQKDKKGPPDPNKKRNPQIDESTIGHLPYPEIPPLLEYMMLTKRLGQVAEGDEAWLKKVRADGRIHGRVNTVGARTWRMTHSGPNMAQVPKADKHTPYGKECRACFKARDGWRLVGADAAGLEARMLANFMAIWDKGEYITIVTTGDIHFENAKGFFNTEEPTKQQRDDAKTPFYARIYGARVKKMAASLKTTKEKAQEIMDAYDARFPAFAKLVATCYRRHNDLGYFVGFDGRHVLSVSEHSSLNSLLQSAGAIIMKYALVRFYMEAVKRFGPHGVRWALCANVHDEIQAESEPEIADELGQLFVDSIKWAGVHLNLKCPLDGAYKVGLNWAETH